MTPITTITYLDRQSRPRVWLPGWYVLIEERQNGRTVKARLSRRYRTQAAARRAARS